MPETKKSPKPGSTTKYHHTTQDDDFNFSYSEDQENIPGSGYSYRDQVPEYSPEIQNNIRKMGAHMVTRMCPPFLIQFHISSKYIPKQAHIKKKYKDMRACLSDLKKYNKPSILHKVYRSNFSIYISPCHH